MGTVFEFGQAIDKFAEKVDAQVEQAMTMIVFSLYRGIKETTPVDTGYARANWQITIGKPASGARPKGDYEAQDLSVMADWKPGQVAWISNNAAYIGALEYGHSGQAPQGMVRVTIENVKAKMASIIEEAMKGKSA